MLHCSQTRLTAQGWGPTDPPLRAELSRMKRICRTCLCFAESFPNSLYFQENKYTYHTESILPSGKCWQDVFTAKNKGIKINKTNKDKYSNILKYVFRVRHL